MITNAPFFHLYRLLLDRKSLLCWQVNSIMSLKRALNLELARMTKILQWSRKPLMYWLKATLTNRYAIVCVCVCVCMCFLSCICTIIIVACPKHLLHVGCGGDCQCFRPLVRLAERCAAEEERKVRHLQSVCSI